MKSLVLFICGTLLFGALTLGIGYWAWGNETLLQGGVAFALAFVPAVVTLAWVLHSYRAAPQLQLLASLGGSGIRMAVALGGGILLTNAQPQSFDMPFWSWLVLFYLVFLGFEITLLVRQQSKLDGGPHS
jgi:hypothetical protein